MGRTNDLRRLVEETLQQVKTNFGLPQNSITYRLASDKTMFPHIVYTITGMTPTDEGREDYTVDFDIWAKDQILSLEIEDFIVDLFSFRNDPRRNILPTFYLVSTGNLEDPDKTLCHSVVRFEVQNYRRLRS